MVSMLFGSVIPCLYHTSLQPDFLRKILKLMLLLDIEHSIAWATELQSILLTGEVRVVNLELNVAICLTDSFQSLYKASR